MHWTDRRRAARICAPGTCVAGRLDRRVRGRRRPSQDRPDRDRSRLPRRFAGDQRPVGLIESTGLAVQAAPRPPQVGTNALHQLAPWRCALSRRRRQDARICAITHFWQVFLAQAPSRLTWITHTTRFDNLTERRYTRRMLLSARLKDVRSRRLHALQHNALHWASVAANSRVHEIARIGPTARLSDRTVRRSGRSGRHMAMVDQRNAEVKLCSLSHPKKITGDRITRGEEARRPSQKLPPTAIYCHFGAAKPLLPFQPFHFIRCPSRACRPAWAPG
jgi:hypothetical protein